MSDLIDRQAAIEVTDAIWAVTGDVNVAKVWQQLKDLPSVQPDLSEYSNKLWQKAYERGKAEERKTGRWIECDHEKWIVGVHGLRCSECNGGYHLNNEMTIYYWNYCPNCGAKMMEVQDDEREGEGNHTGHVG